MDALLSDFAAKKAVFLDKQVSSTNFRKPQSNRAERQI
jgi:hypothetical protein